MRLTEPETGRILIDGINTMRLGLHTLRTNITIIPQTPTLFSGCTVRENLDLFNLHSDEEIHAALQSCRMSDMVSVLPNGWNTVITEGGSNFSGGQRQLFCLARAILSASRILVLDEATASVDRKTEIMIQEAIDKHFASATILTVAHRLDTIIEYDYILVLDQGNVLDFGPPADLLRRQASFFRLISETGDRMANSLQTKAFDKERKEVEQSWYFV
jgi:ATP-binding cassette, subfamily C (CFTR/MRP), member 4